MARFRPSILCLWAASLRMIVMAVLFASGCGALWDGCYRVVEVDSHTDGGSGVRCVSNERPPASGADLRKGINLRAARMLLRSDFIRLGPLLEDLDHDGMLDISVVSHQFVLLRRSMSPEADSPERIDLKLGAYIGAIALADMTRDGQPDLLVSGDGIPDPLVLIPGQKPGSFDWTRSITLEKNFRGTKFLGIGDFDGDGVLDVLANRQGRVEIMWGNMRMDMGAEDDLLGPPDMIRGADGSLLSMATGDLLSMATGDLDNDRKEDFAILRGVVETNAEMMVEIYFSNEGEKRSFRRLERRIPILTVCKCVRTIKTADLDQDGDLDLVLLASKGELSYLLGEGDGSFEGGARSVPLGESAESADVAIGDLNCDGYKDAAVADNSLGVMVLLGRRDGPSGPFSFGAPTIVRSGYLPRYVRLGDIDGDQITDLVVADDGTVSVLFGAGDGVDFNAPLDISISPAPTAVSLADVGNDGRKDILPLLPKSQLGLVRNDPVEGFKEPMLHYLGTDVELAIGNLDPDRYPDLVFRDAAQQQPSLFLLRGIASGWDQQGPAKLDLDYPPSPLPRRPALVYLDKDNNLDLLLTDDKVLTTFLGKGDGTFTKTPSQSNGGYSDTGDIDLDGNLDLLESAVRDPALVYFGEGEGKFGKPVKLMNISFTLLVLANPHQKTEKDTDPGKYPDLIGVSGWDSKLHVWLGQGNRTSPFRTPEVAAPFGRDENNPQDEKSILLVEDMNLDTRPDLLVVSEQRSADQTPKTLTVLSIYPGNGDGTFKAPKSFVAGQIIGLAVSDLNNDGLPDVVVVNGADRSPSISVLWNTSVKSPPQ